MKDIKNKFKNYFIKHISNNNIILLKLNLDHPFVEFYDEFIFKNSLKFNKKDYKKCEKVFNSLIKDFSLIDIKFNKKRDIWELEKVVWDWK